MCVYVLFLRGAAPPRAHTQAGKQFKYEKHAKEALQKGSQLGGDPRFISRFVFEFNTKRGDAVETRVTGRFEEYAGAHGGQTCLGRPFPAASAVSCLYICPVTDITGHAVRGWTLWGVQVRLR